MPLTSNARDISFASKFPIPKIVGVYEGSVSVTNGTLVGGYLYRFDIPHGFTRPVFTKLVWSTDNTNWIDGGYSYRSGDANQYPTIAYSDATNVHILTGLTSGTLYYKLIAFWIDNFDATNPLVTEYHSPNKETAFDSRDNYQKIALQGSTDGTGGDVFITHALGYYPTARVFFEAFPGEVWPANAGGASNYFLWNPGTQQELQYYLSTSNLVLETTPAGRKIWYEVYFDE